MFGRGQRVSLNANFGSIRRNFNLDFTEPYFLDTQFSLGISAYNWELRFDEFNRSGTGGSIRFLYPLVALGLDDFFGFSLVDSRVGLEYRLEQAEIDGVSATAPAQIRTEQGTFVTSSITPRFRRDTRNHPFNPTAGSLQDLSIEIAGIGGKSRFLKAEARGRWYFPFWKDSPLGTFALSLGGNIGYGLGFGNTRELPLFERYFPGGINSIRGYDILSLGPRVIVADGQGIQGPSDAIGGSQQLISNNEIIIPLVENVGLRGVVFFDAGNAFSAAQGFDFDEMRYSTGAGIRWMSPIGPLRIEYGVPLNARENDEEQRIMFSFGGPPS